MSTKTIQDAMVETAIYGESAIRMILESEYQSLVSANAALVESLKKIAVETSENDNFSRSEDEAQYYIDIAKQALLRHGDTGRNEGET